METRSVPETAIRIDLPTNGNCQSIVEITKKEVSIYFLHARINLVFVWRDSSLIFEKSHSLNIYIYIFVW